MNSGAPASPSAWAGYWNAPTIWSNSALWHRQMQVLLEQIRPFVEFSATDRVLDFGCGSGFFAAQMQGRVKQIVCADLSQHSVELCRQKFAGRSDVAVAEDVPSGLVQSAVLLLPITAILALVFVPWGTVWMYKNTVTFSTGEIFRKAHQLFVGRVWFWLAILLLPVIISLGFGFIGGFVVENTVIYSLIQIVSFVVTIVLSYVLTRISILAARGNTVTLEQGWNGFIPVLKYVAVNILVGILTLLATLAFIIPGIYVSLRFMFAPYVLAEKNVSIGEAMSESSRMTRGAKLDLFAFGLI